MNTIRSLRLRKPAPATLMSGSLVVLGLLLLQVHPGFLLLTALGTFGPGLLRELGWLRDQDEFQRRAAHRAGYHAYLVTGLLGFALIALFRDNEARTAAAEEVATLCLSVLWFTWLLSSLLAYWGPHRTARRILLVFGLVWLAFNVLGNLGSAVGLLMQSLLALPFFAMAWLAGRWPRIAGALLLAVSGFFLWLFRLQEILGPEPLGRGRGLVLVLFVGPLVAGSLALLGSGQLRPDED